MDRELISWTAKLLNAVKEGDKQVPLEILVRAKGSDDNGPIYKSVIDAIPGSKVFFSHIRRVPVWYDA